MADDSLRYAGFWPRLGSLLLDGVILLPLIGMQLWAERYTRLFGVYYFLPGVLFGLFYSAYLVQRFGGTPGKLMMGIRIKADPSKPIPADPLPDGSRNVPRKVRNNRTSQ